MKNSTTVSAQQSLLHHQNMRLDNWSETPALMHYTFLHLPEFFPHAQIHRAGSVFVLGDGYREEVAAFPVSSKLGTLPLSAYVETAPVNGIAVCHHGNLVFERYPRMRQHDKHLLMSVSKIFVSTVIALLEERGLVEVKAPLETYLPELRDSGWQGSSVRDVLDMASGIDCPEEGIDDAYTNPARPYYHYEASLGWLEPTGETPATPYEYMPKLSRHKKAGLAFEYTSVNTFVLGWLAEKLLEQPLSEILATQIWSKIGAESDALLAVSRNANAPASHGGISATLRDVVRLGLQFVPTTRLEPGASIVSDQHLKRVQQADRAEIFMRGSLGPKLALELAERPSHNSYQWDFVMSDGDFYKGGYGGQGLYISPSRDLVVAFVGTPEDDGQVNEMPFVCRQLAKGFF